LRDGSHDVPASDGRKINRFQVPPRFRLGESGAKKSNDIIAQCLPPDLFPVGEQPLGRYEGVCDHPADN
ncbi:hypothetical protein ACC713_36895, partial [Rhizobium johnstonii]|uniref:hypothetical protein n=1 Tax=Rhizobium johnstonii TaxID=3019933 RepID=UPI003F989A6A